ncbi:MAG: hypothetical protein MZV70_45530 [Desulfobacterales bacterium]|nr:hypothetical protein [Desulfobacterales bacterium]
MLAPTAVREPRRGSAGAAALRGAGPRARPRARARPARRARGHRGRGGGRARGRERLARAGRAVALPGAVAPHRLGADPRSRAHGGRSPRRGGGVVLAGRGGRSRGPRHPGLPRRRTRHAVARARSRPRRRGRPRARGPLAPPRKARSRWICRPRRAPPPRRSSRRSGRGATRCSRRSPSRAEPSPSLTPALLAATRAVDLPDEGNAGFALAAAAAREDQWSNAWPTRRTGDASRRGTSTQRGEAVLREDDRDGDGTPDRWTAAPGGRSREVGRRATLSGVPARTSCSRPTARWSASRCCGPATASRPASSATSAAGLVAESADTNADGRLDRFERFDTGGEVASREEDLDGDGTIDVRSRYEKGRLVRREITDPSLVERMLRK